jgi:hypothetical protein
MLPQRYRAGGVQASSATATGSSRAGRRRAGTAIHPSAILRADDERRESVPDFVDDLAISNLAA